ncbi:type II secretion system protein GspG, partial [Candidatus Gracilibacteria bacterium]|nr:type II secretion system protein GspG [Candidatus Gracilibacteria bacterium]
ELIVVITILAILGTIGFVSFNGYSNNARDSVRISDLTNIQKLLDLYQVKVGSYPTPDNAVTITANNTPIGYQGYASGTVLFLIQLSDGGKDPLDNTYYTYLTNSNKTKYQLLNFLENKNNQLSHEKIYKYENKNNKSMYLITLGLDNFVQTRQYFVSNLITKSYADLFDYSKRYINTKGAELGILLNSGTLVPIQANNGTGVDIINTTGSYIAQFGNKDTDRIKGTGAELKRLEAINTLVSSGKSSLNINDIINGSLAGYWDMETTTSDGKLADLSGNGNHGVGSGGVIIGGIPGTRKTGKATSFDGINDYFIVTDNLSLNVTNLTISAWIKPRILVNATHQRIITKNDIQGYMLNIYGDYYESYIGNKPLSISSTSIGLWSHVIITTDGTRLKSYINGDLIYDLVYTGSISGGTGNLNIGSDSPSIQAFFNGVIDEVRIYNRALSDLEIQTLYNTTK